MCLLTLSGLSGYDKDKADARNEENERIHKST